MDIKIFDVEHGFCALIKDDSGKRILIECGHNTYTGFNPTDYLLNNRIKKIDELWISNFDEDHISNLAVLVDNVEIETVCFNVSIDSDTLHDWKENNGITENMNALLDIIDSYDEDDVKPVLKNCKEYTFYNKYPSFDDTNNLSAVFFLFYRDIRLCYPGDLETDGWEKLLRNKDFCDKLKRVNILVASHHGRDSGYCEDVFDYCHPDIVIISDKEIRYSTQNQLYQKHCKGIILNDQRRKVLTTRQDGRIGIRQKQGNKREIYIG